MKKCLVVAALCVCISHLSAQSSINYDRAIGIKIPVGFAVTYKQFLQDDQNIEGVVTFRDHSFVATGLYEFNWIIPGIDGLCWFAGAGAHIGFRDKNYSKSSNNSKAGLGIDGVIGLDYKVAGLPLNISLDWQPAVDLIGSSGNGAAYGGIGVRYTF